MPISCAHFQALASGTELEERNAEFGSGRGREDLSAAGTVDLHGKVTSFACAHANLLLSAGEKPQLRYKAKAKKKKSPDWLPLQGLQARGILMGKRLGRHSGGYCCWYIPPFWVDSWQCKAGRSQPASLSCCCACSMMQSLMDTAACAAAAVPHQTMSRLCDFCREQSKLQILR